jgi:hypothetical protein
VPQRATDLRRRPSRPYDLPGVSRSERYLHVSRNDFGKIDIRTQVQYGSRGFSKSRLTESAGMRASHLRVYIIPAAHPAFANMFFAHEWHGVWPVLKALGAGNEER